MITFPMNRRDALAGLAAGAATLALPPLARAATGASADAARLLDGIAWRLAGANPETATTLGIDSGVHASLRHRLADRSPAGIKALADMLRADLAQVEALDTAGLDAPTATSVAVVRSAYRNALDGLALPYGDVAVGSWRNTPYVVIQNVGAYIDTPRFLDADHPIRNADDAEAYLDRLSALPAQLDGERERMEAAQRMGLVPPRFLIEKTLAQLEAATADARSGGSMVESLERRTRDIPGDWAARARATVTGPVAAAMARQIEPLRAMLPVSTGDAGLWARPHGDEFYAWALRASTTTSRSAEEIHQRGLAELAELHARMDPLLRGLGFTSGTVGERMRALGKDPRFAFSEGDKGRAEIIALMQQKLDFIRTKLPMAFRRLVRGNLEIRRLSPAEEPGAPNAYGGAGSIDGSIPGKVWLNLSDPARHSRFSVPDLGFHEGIPGHVWQGEYANQLPLIRSLLAFNAYSEGWALYAEQLADELGAYEGDPVGRLGYLQSLAFRACRMVVDTGLHAKRWTREQGVAFFVEKNGSNPLEVAAEVDRYCSWPGQACGYKMGHGEIVAQRALAMRELGPRFDLRDFNQAVVDGGNVPLDVLATNVAGYVARSR